MADQPLPVADQPRPGDQSRSRSEERRLIADRITELVAPVVSAAGLDLYDVSHHNTVIRVLVDSETGVDLAGIARLSRSIGRCLDEHDPVAHRYTLEVSSPGLERPLRTPAHFQRALGSDVKVKVAPGFDGPRRINGVLLEADALAIGIETGDETHRVGYAEIVSARTVFDWATNRRPGRTRTPSSDSSSSTTNGADGTSRVSTTREARS